MPIPLLVDAAIGAKVLGPRRRRLSPFLAPRSAYDGPESYYASRTAAELFSMGTDKARGIDAREHVAEVDANPAARPAERIWAREMRMRGVGRTAPAVQDLIADNDLVRGQEARAGIARGVAEGDPEGAPYRSALASGKVPGVMGAVELVSKAPLAALTYASKASNQQPLAAETARDVWLGKTSYYDALGMPKGFLSGVGNRIAEVGTDPVNLVPLHALSYAFKAGSAGRKLATSAIPAAFGVQSGISAAQGLASGDPTQMGGALVDAFAGAALLYGARSAAKSAKVSSLADDIARSSVRARDAEVGVDYISATTNARVRAVPSENGKRTRLHFVEPDGSTGKRVRNPEILDTPLVRPEVHAPEVNPEAVAAAGNANMAPHVRNAAGRMVRAMFNGAEVQDVADGSWKITSRNGRTAVVRVVDKMRDLSEKEAATAAAAHGIDTADLDPIGMYFPDGGKSLGVQDLIEIANYRGGALPGTDVGVGIGTGRRTIMDIAGFHEAFHFAMDNTLTGAQYMSVMQAFGKRLGADVGGPVDYRKLSPERQAEVSGAINEVAARYYSENGWRASPNTWAGKVHNWFGKLADTMLGMLGNEDARATNAFRAVADGTASGKGMRRFGPKPSRAAVLDPAFEAKLKAEADRSKGSHGGGWSSKFLWDDGTVSGGIGVSHGEVIRAVGGGDGAPGRAARASGLQDSGAVRVTDMRGAISYEIAGSVSPRQMREMERKAASKADFYAEVTDPSGHVSPVGFDNVDKLRAYLSAHDMIDVAPRTPRAAVLDPAFEAKLKAEAERAKKSGDPWGGQFLWDDGTVSSGLGDVHMNVALRARGGVPEEHSSSDGWSTTADALRDSGAVRLHETENGVWYQVTTSVSPRQMRAMELTAAGKDEFQAEVSSPDGSEVLAAFTSVDKLRAYLSAHDMIDVSPRTPRAAVLDPALEARLREQEGVTPLDELLNGSARHAKGRGDVSAGYFIYDNGDVSGPVANHSMSMMRARGGDLPAGMEKSGALRVQITNHRDLLAVEAGGTLGALQMKTLGQLAASRANTVIALGAGAPGGPRHFTDYDVFRKYASANGLVDVAPPSARAAVRPGGFMKSDVEPAVERGVERVGKMWDNFLSLSYPRARVPRAGMDALTRRLGDIAESHHEAVEALRPAAKVMKTLSWDEQIAFADAMKTGAPQASAELDGIAATLREIDDASWRAMRDAGIAVEYKANHLRVEWDVIPAMGPGARIGDVVTLATGERGTVTAGSGMTGITIKGSGGAVVAGDVARIDKIARKNRLTGQPTGGQSPLRGTRDNLKQATVPTLSEGIRMGGVPRTVDPVEMVVRNAVDSMRHVAALRMFESLKASGLLKYDRSGSLDKPVGFEPVKDAMFDTYRGVMEGRYNKTPVNAPLIFMDTGNTVPTKTGTWWVEQNTARLLNNTIAPDLIRGVAGLDMLMPLRNYYAAVELIGPMFHAMTVGAEASMSAAGMDIRKVVNLGDMRGLGMIPNALAAPVKMTLEGKALQRYVAQKAREKYGTASLKELDAIAKFDARWAKANPGKPLPVEFIKGFLDAGGQLHMSDEYRTVGMRAAREFWSSGNKAGGLLRGVGAFPNWFSSWLFEHTIPAMKLGVYAEEVALRTRERAADIAKDPAIEAEIRRGVVDFIDDRFGEVNWNALFMNPNVKTIMQLMMRSPSWRGGSLRAFVRTPVEQVKEVGAAVRDRRRPRVEPGVAWMAGMGLSTAVIGAVASKARSGKFPWEWEGEDKVQDLVKNFVFPHASSTDTRARMALPGYQKLLYELLENPLAFLTGGRSGFIARGQEAINNETYFGDKIAQPGMGGPESFARRAVHAVVPTPFVYSGAAKSAKLGEGASGIMASLAGYGPAPRRISMTPFEKFVGAKLGEQFEGMPGRTAEQAAARDVTSEVVNSLRAGDRPRKVAAIRAAKSAVRSGTITAAQFSKALTAGQVSANVSNVTKMSRIEDVIEAYSLANEAERAEVRPKVRAKVAKWLAEHGGAPNSAAVIKAAAAAGLKVPGVPTP